MKLTEWIHARVTEQEKKDFKKLAVKEGRTLSNFLRYCIIQNRIQGGSYDHRPEKSKKIRSNAR